MRVLIDTNVLTRAAQVGHAHHQAAVQCVLRLNERQVVLCLAPQNLYESWVVCTRPFGENGLGMSVEETARRIAELGAAFELLDETPAFRPAWEALVVRHEVRGKAAHDARLVTAMNVHGLEVIVTFDKQHFARYPGILAMTPDDAQSSAILGTPSD